MNALLNYLVESNLGLCVFMLAYVVLLQKETDFVRKRIFLLTAVLVSLLFPLIHLDTTQSVIPSLAKFVPPNWLPEVVIYGDGTPKPIETRIHFDSWFIIHTIYSVGVLAAMLIFLIRLVRLIQLLTSAPGRRSGGYYLIESPENRSSFSFFRYIYIGQADKLSSHEKGLIVDHECIHAKRLHSFDILLMNVVGIFFWFNPVINIYKKIFVQLHEYEADARAVEHRDVNNYCSLLAKVALLSADYSLANHFSNSLTLKRIEMMRTFKAKIKGWKVLAIVLTLPSFFFVVSCQDQVINDVTDIARNSNNALLAPDVVQARFEEVKKANPNANYILVELNDTAEKKLMEMEKNYGIPSSIELYTPDNGEYKKTPTLTGKADAGVIIEKINEHDDLHTYAIIEYNEMTNQVSNNSAGEDQIFTVVEKAAEYPGGMPALAEYLMTNLKYPSQARMQGIEGSVYVSFVVEKDGSIGNVSVIKGISNECDEEAARVVSGFPNWAPGEQNGKVVRSRFTIPIKYALAKDSKKASAVDIRADNEKFQVTYSVVEEAGAKVLKGRVLDSSNEPLPGANVIIKGTTSGTKTDMNGEFVIKPAAGTNAFVISFVGYDSEERSY